MKKNLLLLGIFAVLKMSSQCAATSTSASASVYSMTAVYNASMGLNVAICCNGILYDTLNNNNNMNYFVHPGGVLYKKGGVTTFVWLDGGSTLINKGGTSAIIAYSENTATITNLSGPPVNNNTCTAVSMPAGNCFPAGGPCGNPSLVKDINGYSERISIINAGAGKLQIKNGNNIPLIGKVYDIVGRFLFDLYINTGNNLYDVPGNRAGVFFIQVYAKETGPLMSYKVLID